jgi:hypothetical protein
MRRHITVTIVLVTFACVLLANAQQKKPLLSPRRQAEFTFEDGKKIKVDYGAPSMRGRKIMGELVPYGKVWRTGANEATSFVTDADLVIGSANVPAGKYTLYTLPGDNEWQLIINKQTGQWGTVYDQAQDLIRIGVKPEKLPQAVEQLTFSFHKNGADAATMRVQWENTGLSVDIKEKK